MGLIYVSDVSGFALLRHALRDAMIAVDVELTGALAEATQHISDQLRDATPVSGGYGGAENPAGDSDGPLAYSYVPTVAHYTPGRANGRVTTTQPTKTKYVRYGTGVYGPRGQRIYPRRARALRWLDRSGVHFAASIAGQRPNDFITPIVERGLDEAKDLCFAAVSAAITDTLIL